MALKSAKLLTTATRAASPLNLPIQSLMLASSGAQRSTTSKVSKRQGGSGRASKMLCKGEGVDSLYSALIVKRAIGGRLAQRRLNRRNQLRQEQITWKRTVTNYSGYNPKCGSVCHRSSVSIRTDRRQLVLSPRVKVATPLVRE